MGGVLLVAGLPAVLMPEAQPKYCGAIVRLLIALIAALLMATPAPPLRRQPARRLAASQPRFVQNGGISR